MKLSNISSKNLIKALLKSDFNYAPIKGKGSHTALVRENLEGRRFIVIIPKRNPIPIGTLKSIIKQKGLSQEQFNEILEEFY